MKILPCLLRVASGVFAILVGDRAGSLAGRLARGLTLATAAVFQRVLQQSGLYRLYMLHSIPPPTLSVKKPKESIAYSDNYAKYFLFLLFGREEV